MSQQSAFRFQAFVRGLHGCQKQPVVHAVDEGVFAGVEGGGVEIATAFLVGAQHPERAGHLVEVVGEVFAAEDRLGDLGHLAALPENRCHLLVAGGVVGERRVAVNRSDLTPSVRVEVDDPLDLRLELRVKLRAPFGVEEGPNREPELRAAGADVACRPSVKLGGDERDGLVRAERTESEAFECLADPHADVDGVRAGVRHGHVAAGAGDFYLQPVRVGEHRAGAGQERSHRVVRIHVQAVDRLDSFADPLANETGAAGFGEWVLFGPLPHKSEVGGRDDISVADRKESTEEHGTVHVVAAGVHLTVR